MNKAELLNFVEEYGRPWGSRTFGSPRAVDWDFLFREAHWDMVKDGLQIRDKFGLVKEADQNSAVVAWKRKSYFPNTIIRLSFYPQKGMHYDLVFTKDQEYDILKKTNMMVQKIISSMDSESQARVFRDKKIRVGIFENIQNAHTPGYVSEEENKELTGTSSPSLAEEYKLWKERQQQSSAWGWRV
jgi:hypothetical protein|tara:strand:- start:8559 stop:9116 length:558 start_codon:yes stop_codon:yes gene_type:complete